MDDILNGYQPDVIISHADCDDGFAAAWLGYRRWGSQPITIFSSYNKKPPLKLCTGKHVLITDFSYKPEALLSLSEVAETVIILDHHETAEETLSKYALSMESLHICLQGGSLGVGLGLGSNVYAVFNKKKCGASLMWEFLYGDKPLSRFMGLIEDQDLWKDDRYKGFSIFLRSHPMTFESWDAVAMRVDYAAGRGWDEITKEADALQRYYDQLCEKIALNSYWDTICGVRMPVVNAPHIFASDVTRILMRTFKTNVAASYEEYEEENKRLIRWSLRSDNDGGPNVAKLCATRGGGGHEHAAGFSVSKF